MFACIVFFFSEISSTVQSAEEDLVIGSKAPAQLLIDLVLTLFCQLEWYPTICVCNTYHVITSQ